MIDENDKVAPKTTPILNVFEEILKYP